MRNAFSTRLSSADRGAYGRELCEDDVGCPTGSVGAWPTTEDRRGRFPEERGDWGREVWMADWGLRMYVWAAAGANVMLDEGDPGRPGTGDRPLPVE
jgi:hypothetical protein